MDAEQQRGLAVLQLLRRGDVGLDHALLDQLVGVEAFGRHHPLDQAMGVEHQAALRQVKLQRFAGVAALQQDGIGGPQRLQHALEQRLGLVVGMAVDGGLRLLVGQLGGGAHDDALEAVLGLPARLVEAHEAGQRRTLFLLAQRAQVVGDALGQHRHHAIGEIDRVAADAGLAVQGRAGSHIGGNVGDGDDDICAAGGLVDLGPDGVVMVARILGVDGEEGHATEVGAALAGKGLERFGLAQHALREVVWNAVVVNGDQRDVALVVHVAQPLAHPGGGQAVAALLDDLGLDQFAVQRAILVALLHLQFVAGLLVHRHDAGTEAGNHAIDAQHLVGAIGQRLDHPAAILVAAILRGLDLGQHPVALARGLFGTLDHHVRGLAGLALVPFDGLGEGLAILVGADDLEHGDGGQRRAVDQLAGALGQQAHLLHALQQRLEADLVAPLDVEMARDLALADNRGRGLDELQDVGLGGELGLGNGALCHGSRSSRE